MRYSLILCLGASLLLPAFAAEPPRAEAHRGPRDVLWRLRQGNLAYTGGRLTARPTPARRAALVAAQKPRAVVLTCADSRVPPEYIFNEGLGALFVVRVAGGVADPVTVGSVEYGIEHLHAPLVVVMGHTRCGAVKAALETPPAKPGAPAAGVNIESILGLIRPGIPKGSTHPDAWTAAVYGGVEQTAEDLFRVSRIIPEMAKTGEIGVIGAVYEIETGKVVFSRMLAAEAGEHAAGSAPLVDWSPEAPRVASVTKE
jgi:carbonic anhydrase